MAVRKRMIYSDTLKYVRFGITKSTFAAHIAKYVDGCLLYSLSPWSA